MAEGIAASEFLSFGAFSLEQLLDVAAALTSVRELFSQQEGEGVCPARSVPVCFQAEAADSLWDAGDAPASSVGADSL